MKEVNNAPTRKRKQSEPPFSLLQRLAEEGSDVFALVLEKLTDDEVQRLSSVSSAIRKACRSRLLRYFIQRSRDAWETSRLRLCLRFSRSSAGEMTRFGQPISQNPDVHGNALWEHFPGEFRWVDRWMKRTGKKFYWMSAEWQRRREGFLQATLSHDLEDAAALCGELRRERRHELVRTAGGRELICGSIHYWCLASILDFGSRPTFSGVFIHPDCVLFKHAVQSASSQIQETHALFYCHPEYAVELVPFPRAFMHDANTPLNSLIPEPLADNTIWIPESAVHIV